MRHIDEDTLVRRLDRLERQNRRLGSLVLALCALVGVGSLVGFAQQDEVVWGRQFILVDTEGNKRAELGTDSDGASILSFFDAAGRLRTELGSTRAGTGLLRIRSRGGTTRFSVQLTRQGALASFFAANGTRIAGFGANEDGHPHVVLNDAESGEPRLSLVLDEEPKVVLLDDEGEEAATIDAEAWKDKD